MALGAGVNSAHLPLPAVVASGGLAGAADTIAELPATGVLTAVNGPQHDAGRSRPDMGTPGGPRQVSKQQLLETMQRLGLSDLAVEAERPDRDDLVTSLGLV